MTGLCLVCQEHEAKWSKVVLDLGLDSLFQTYVLIFSRTWPSSNLYDDFFPFLGFSSVGQEVEGKWTLLSFSWFIPIDQAYSSTSCFLFPASLAFILYIQSTVCFCQFVFILLDLRIYSQHINAIIVVDHKFLHLVHGPYIVFLSGDFICLVFFMGNSNYVLEMVLLSFSFSFPRTLIVAYIVETWLMIPPWVVAFMCCTLLVQMMLN